MSVSLPVYVVVLIVAVVCPEAADAKDSVGVGGVAYQQCLERCGLKQQAVSVHQV